MSSKTVDFKAEVAKVLDIVIHSLYSHNEIFLRELISNASDACDKLRYAILFHPEFAHLAKEGFKIKLIPNLKQKTLSVLDNGIGMNEEDLINNLGTIARSGSAEFLKGLTGDKQKDISLIGQFGVGFYASFMVADKVIVKTKKAGEEIGYIWESNGAGSFTISEEKNINFGTEVILFLKKDSLEYLEAIRLQYLVKQYSDHISVPVVLVDEKKEETINEGKALWLRPKSEITLDQYKEFYQRTAHAFDEPWLTLHYKAEGAIDYTALLFIPTKPPFNLFQPDRKSNLSLYVNRVFISDDISDLMPMYLRFVVGLVDTKDLPLNVSREMLQKTPVLTKIKTGLIRRVLGELKKKTDQKEEYDSFWKNFGIVLKEGLYEPSEQREEIAKLCRFYSTRGENLVSFDEYIHQMKEKQKFIYYINGTDLQTLKNNPQLEGFVARGIEVLLLTDPIDEFWVQSFQEVQGKKIISVMHAKEDLGEIPLLEEGEIKKDVFPEEEKKNFIEKVEKILAEEVEKVQFTERLTKSPMALITPEGQMSLNLERMMKAHGQEINFSSGRILEINVFHPLIKDLVKLKEDKKDLLQNSIWILYDQARISEGETVKDIKKFSERLESFIKKSL